MRDLEQLVKRIFDLKLKIPEGFPSDWKNLVDVYNGCGPDSMPECFRDLLTFVFSDFEEAFCVHDYDYSKSDGTKETYTQVAQRITENVFLLCNEDGKNPLEYEKLRIKANLVLEALEKFGYDSYVKSSKRGKENE